MDLLAHLEAYVAVVDEANFSRAADRLGIAQPLLSRRVKTLEEHFGGPLFDRSRRQVSVTELGLLLVPYARDVLDRAQRLHHVAGAARRSAVRAVGVPEDCDPAVLARVIRAGAERGVTVAVRELPPQERESGLADGSLAYALTRVPPESAGLRVPLGLASAPVPGARAGSEGSGGAGSRDGARPGLPRGHAGRSGTRAVHLEDLRPRRVPSAGHGSAAVHAYTYGQGDGHAHGPGRAGGPGYGQPTVAPVPLPVPVLVLPEDQVAHAQDRLGRAVERAGLPRDVIRPAGPTATALAETLAGRVLLLCTEAFARRHGAAWAPLADVSLHRGYEAEAATRYRHRQRSAPGRPAPDRLVTRDRLVAPDRPAGPDGPGPGRPGPDGPEEATGVPGWLAALLETAAGLPVPSPEATPDPDGHGVPGTGNGHPANAVRPTERAEPAHPVNPAVRLAARG